MKGIETFINQYKVDIIVGKLVPGDQLPSAPELAAIWSCDMETVEIGLGHLVEMQLIQIESGKPPVVLDYKVTGKMACLEFAFGSEDVRMGEQRMHELYDFIKVTFDDYIRLAARKGLDTHAKEDLLKHLWRDEHYEDETVFSNKVFDFYKTLAVHSQNFVYPLLLNTLKDGICKIASRIQSSQNQIEIISMLIQVIDALYEKDEDHALFMNRQVMAKFLMEWKRSHDW